MIFSEISIGPPNTDPLLCLIRVYARGLSAVGLSTAYVVWDAANSRLSFTDRLMEATVWPSRSNAQVAKNHFRTINRGLMPTSPPVHDATYRLRSVENECHLTTDHWHVVYRDSLQADTDCVRPVRYYLRVSDADSMFQRRTEYAWTDLGTATHYRERRGAIEAMRNYAAHDRLSRDRGPINVSPRTIENERVRLEGLESSSMFGFVIRCSSSTVGHLPAWHEGGHSELTPTRELQRAARFDSVARAREAIGNFPLPIPYVRVESVLDAMVALVVDETGRHRDYSSEAVLPETPRTNEPAIVEPVLIIGGRQTRRTSAAIPNFANPGRDSRTPSIAPQHGFGPGPPPAAVPLEAPPAPQPIWSSFVDDEPEATPAAILIERGQAEERRQRGEQRPRQPRAHLPPEACDAVTIGDWVLCPNTPFFYLVIGYHLDDLLLLRSADRWPPESGVSPTPLALNDDTIRIVHRSDLSWSSRAATAPPPPTAGNHRNISLDES